MADRTFGEGFTEDDARRSSALLRYLDAVAAVPGVARAKAAATAALDLQPGATVLELGCGTGVDLPALAAAVGPGGRVVGVDPSAQALAAAAVRTADAGWVQLVVGTAEALPLPDGSCDACRTDRTLQHVADPEGALREIARVLRPGGRLVVLELGVRLAGSRADALAPIGRRLFDTGEQAWLPLMLPLLLARAGFEAVETETLAAPAGGPEDVRAVLRVDAAVEEALADGSLSAAQARACRAALDGADEDALRLELSPVRFSARRSTG